MCLQVPNMTRNPGSDRIPHRGARVNERALVTDPIPAWSSGTGRDRVSRLLPSAPVAHQCTNSCIMNPMATRELNQMRSPRLVGRPTTKRRCISSLRRANNRIGRRPSVRERRHPLGALRYRRTALIERTGRLGVLARRRTPIHVGSGVPREARRRVRGRASRWPATYTTEHTAPDGFSGRFSDVDPTTS